MLLVCAKRTVFRFALVLSSLTLHFTKNKRQQTIIPIFCLHMHGSCLSLLTSVRSLSRILLISFVCFVSPVVQLLFPSSCSTWRFHIFKLWRHHYTKSKWICALCFTRHKDTPTHSHPFAFLLPRAHTKIIAVFHTHSHTLDTFGSTECHTHICTSETSQSTNKITVQFTSLHIRVLCLQFLCIPNKRIAFIECSALELNSVQAHRIAF